MNTSKSPAVVALEKERAGQQAQNSDALEAGLEGTFPASDPVSSTVTSIPAGTTVPPSADKEAAIEAPLVDIALANIREHTDIAASVTPDEELAALRAEVNRLSESVAEIGSASVRILRAKSEGMLEDARARISAQPVRAVALAMLAGFLFGAVR
ncbi:hypothetical protein [Neorhizobium sp. LjRoot104]|uniref:hypothetical protein n=1 Tax=Neorhizobium sp. LjRoot104 TaxID=3342254 RepID=UPI003ECE9384